jgi:glycosyltransferase involved in cell wall biosynthesis
MRIVLATETFLPHIDGIVTRLTHTITHLLKAGDEVLIIAPRRPDSPKSFLEAEVLTVPGVSLPYYPDISLASPIMPFKVQQRITSFRPDLIHIVSPAFLGFGPMLAAHRRGLPLIASYHVQYPEYVEKYGLGFTVPFVRWYLRSVHNSARLTLATSLPMVRELRRWGMHNVDHWRPGVDAERFHPDKRSATARARLSGGNPDEFLLICVSRLGIEKEIERLVPILRMLSGVRLALVGDGPARKQLEAAFAGLPVVFTGMIKDKEELAEAYASADAFVLPSPTETLGLVALEAMAAGVPAIVANRGGLPDLVIDGQTGYLFDPDDPADLPSRILALHDAPDLRQAMASSARQHAERFSWSQTTRQLRGYYARALGQFDMADAELVAADEE